MIVSSSGTATSAAGPGLPAVTAYSVNSARSMERPYLGARFRRHLVDQLTHLLEPPAEAGVIAVPARHGGPDDHLARRPVVPGSAPPRASGSSARTRWPGTPARRSRSISKRWVRKACGALPRWDVERVRQAAPGCGVYRDGGKEPGDSSSGSDPRGPGHGDRRRGRPPRVSDLGRVRRMPAGRARPEPNDGQAGRGGRTALGTSASARPSV